MKLAPFLYHHIEVPAHKHIMNFSAKGEVAGIYEIIA